MLKCLIPRFCTIHVFKLHLVHSILHSFRGAEQRLNLGSGPRTPQFRRGGTAKELESAGQHSPFLCPGFLTGRAKVIAPSSWDSRIADQWGA